MTDDERFELLAHEERSLWDRVFCKALVSDIVFDESEDDKAKGAARVADQAVKLRRQRFAVIDADEKGKKK